MNPPNSRESLGRGRARLNFKRNVWHGRAWTANLFQREREKRGNLAMSSRSHPSRVGNG